jgi:hypothetical protein
MPSEKEKSLEMRITQLESTISKLKEGSKRPDISAEELKTYLKVNGLLNPFLTSPQVCSVPDPRLNSYYRYPTYLTLCFPGYTSVIPPLAGVGDGPTELGK